MLVSTHKHRVKLILASVLMMLASPLPADTPEDNDLPILAMRILGSNLFTEDITLELLCELSWLNFDAVNFAGTASKEEFGDLMSLCDSLGVFYTICPNEVMQYLKAYGDTTYRYWFRNSDSTFTSNYSFAQCNIDFDSLTRYTSADAIYDDSSYSIRTTIIDELAYSSIDHDFLWFYEVYDEAPAQQWRHAVENEDPWDDYIPNVYTQDTLGLDTLSLEEIEASGLFSIQKFYAENNEENEVPFTLNFSLLHTIDQEDYTGLGDDIAYGTMSDQARSVRAMMEAEYQPPPVGQYEPSPRPNSPAFIMFDYYPFRYVHSEYSSTTAMCDDEWLFLIEHLEEGIDSTVIPAWEDSVTVFFFPQTFGIAGGSVMYTDGVLDYSSYLHRKPAPQEFRMLCNLALLHQAKGIFPYNLTSYLAPYGPGMTSTRIMSALLDLHNIPFDAPYEEWVYTGRWPDDDFEYIRPDSIPPWISGYDPLFTLSSYPILLVGDPKNNEIHYEWLFEPYADLYNNVGDILGEVNTIGPEMHDLWWCSNCDSADISYDGVAPGDLVSPVIKVFENEEQDVCYLFYVDRYCLSNNNPYEITFDPNDLPEHADCSAWLLDHSRRFIMEGEWDRQDSVYVFLDTLDAGEGRLCELVDPRDTLTADLRITSPDIWMISGTDTTTSMRATVNDSITILADFHNLGTVARSNVTAILYDSTDTDTLGTDNIAFSGLDYTPDSLCRRTDMQTASFGWRPDATEIGAHRMTVSVPSGIGEPNTDENMVEFVFLVDPRDYATDVIGDAWDMDDDTTSAWYTCDIDSVALNWDTTSTGWTDSVSGMFEGSIRFDSGDVVDFRGEISLSVPVDTSKYINTNRYHLFSMGIAINNSWRTDNNPCAVFIGWSDTADSSYGWKNLLQGTDYSIDNGWDGWTVIGPIDLDYVGDSSWTYDDVTDLRLRFQSNAQFYPIPPDHPDSIDVRIGWIRLEESGE